MLLLKAKPDKLRQHGNGIMYGGEPKRYEGLPGNFDYEVHEIFYVETDFGNHMKLSWAELTEMFEVVGVRDYQQWRLDRTRLQSQKNYVEQRENPMTWEMMV